MEKLMEGNLMPSYGTTITTIEDAVGPFQRMGEVWNHDFKQDRLKSLRRSTAAARRKRA